MSLVVYNADKTQPFSQWQIVEVTFPSTPNTDVLVTHNMSPDNPEDIGYLVLRCSAPVYSISHDMSGTRRPWVNGLIALRSSVPSTQATILLFVTTTGFAHQLGQSGLSDGYWTDYTPTLAASAGSATLNTLTTCKYTVVGKTMFVDYYMTITLSGTPVWVSINLPVNTPANHASGPLIDSNGPAGMTRTVIGDAHLYLYRSTSGTINWPTGSNIITGSVAFPIN